MAKEQKLEVGIINVVMEKHQSKSYIDMFSELCDLNSEVILGSERRARLTGKETVDSLHYTDISGKVFSGTIYRYNEISTNQPWHDTNANKTASPDAVKKVNIPPNLKPHEKKFDFVFFEDGHKLVYQSYLKGNSLTPSQATSIFEKFFNKPDIINNYGTVTATHMPDESSLQDVFKHYKTIKLVKLHILRPNADHNDGLDQQVLQRMQALNAESMDKIYSAPRDESINVDESLQSDSSFASENGIVEIKGKDRDGKPASYRSKKHPKTEVKYFDPDSTTPENFFVRTAKALYRQVTGKI